jgi:hypothetical protein
VASRRHCHTGCLKKDLHNGIPNTTTWRVLRKRLLLKVHKLSIVQHLERRIVCMPSSPHSSIWNTVKMFDTPSITSGSRIEPQVSQIKLGVFCYVVTVQNTVHVLSINLYKLLKL